MRPDVEMTFGEHLEELRRRLILALLGLLVGTVLCGVFYQELLTVLLRPYNQALEALEARGGPPPPKEESPARSAPPEPAPPPGTAIEERLAAIEARLSRIEPSLPGASPPASRTPSATAGPPSSAPAQPQSRLILRSPMTGYIMIILMCLIMGVILASPWVIYQIWAFVGVGLHPHERKHIYTYGPASFLLFLGGGSLFYFYILPIGLQALMSPTAGIKVNGTPLIDPSFMLDEYLYFVALMTLVFGLAFQTPLVVLFLAKSRIVPLETLVRQQRFVILLMFILGAVFTPTVDPVSMTAMAVPLILLYELGLLLAWLMQRRDQRAEQTP